MANQYSRRKPLQLPLPMENEIFEIPLTQGYVTIVDAIDADLAASSLFVLFSQAHNKPYARRNVYYQNYKRGKGQS